MTIFIPMYLHFTWVNAKEHLIASQRQTNGTGWWSWCRARQDTYSTIMLSANVQGRIRGSYVWLCGFQEIFITY